MGNSASEAIENQIVLPEGTYEHNRAFEDLRYGAVQVYSHPQTNKFIAKSTKFDNGEEEHLRRKAEAEMALQLKHHHLIEIKKVLASKKSEACSTFYILNIYSQFLFYGLDKEIQRRRQYNEGFDEEEIWYVGDCVLGGVDFLASKGVYHEDVRPLNVLIENDGSIRLFWNNALRPGFNQFVKLSSNEKDNECYLSPLLFAALKGGSPQNDPVKSDVFSTGMTLLEMASNTSVIDCYEPTSYKVNEGEIEKRLQAASSSYSPALIKWIREMLQMEETKRQDPSYFQSQVPRQMHSARIRVPNEDNQAAAKVHNQEPHSQVQNTPIKRVQDTPLNSPPINHSHKSSIEAIQPNIVHSRIENPIQHQNSNPIQYQNRQIPPIGINSVSRTKSHNPSQSVDHLNANHQISYKYQPPQNNHVIQESSRNTYTNRSNQPTLEFLYLNKDYNEPVNFDQQNGNQREEYTRSLNKTEGSYTEGQFTNKKFRDYYNANEYTSPLRSNIQKPIQIPVQPQINLPVTHYAFQQPQVIQPQVFQPQVYRSPMPSQNRSQVSYGIQPISRLGAHQSYQQQIPAFIAPSKEYVVQNNEGGYSHPQNLAPVMNNHISNQYVSGQTYQSPFKQQYPTKKFEAKTFESSIISRSERKDFQNEFQAPRVENNYRSFESKEFPRIESNYRSFETRIPEQHLTSVERTKLGPIVERERILQDIDRINVDQIIQEVKNEQRKRVVGSRY